MPFSGSLRALDLPPRPTTRERAVLEFLLGRPFQGWDDLRRLDYAWVTGEFGLDGPTILLRMGGCTGVIARLDLLIPVELEYTDEGDVPAHVLLDARDGSLSELEAFKEESAPLSLPTLRGASVSGAPTVVRLSE